MLNMGFFYHLIPRQTISKFRVNLLSFYVLKLRGSAHKNMLDKW